MPPPSTEPASEGADWLINPRKPHTKLVPAVQPGLLTETRARRAHTLAVVTEQPSPKVENRRFNGRFPIIEWYVHRMCVAAAAAVAVASVVTVAHRARVSGVRYGNYGLR